VKELRFNFLNLVVLFLTYTLEAGLSPTRITARVGNIDIF
tara:strand:+ start:261 stop:380 length:120 start_codon:yes stop_codon:yes gene_type:complete